MRWSWTEPSKMPDRHTIPRSWEAAWEGDFELSYGPERPRNLSEICSPAVANVMLESKEGAMNHEQHRRSICRFQERIVGRIAGIFAEHNFEREWKALSPEKREETILQGLVNAFNNILCMEVKRMWCPDSSLKNLAAQGGYIQMLKAFLPSDIGATIEEPLSVPCQTVDNILTLTEEEKTHAGYRIMALGFALCRAECITSILWNILMVFVRPRRKARAQIWDRYS